MPPHSDSTNRKAPVFEMSQQQTCHTDIHCKLTGRHAGEVTNRNMDEKCRYGWFSGLQQNREKSIIQASERTFVYIYVIIVLKTFPLQFAICNCVGEYFFYYYNNNNNNRGELSAQCIIYSSLEKLSPTTVLASLYILTTKTQNVTTRIQFVFALLKSTVLHN